MIRVSVLTIGSEILDGRIQDTNAQYFAQKLSETGISLETILTCTDDIEEIVESLQFLQSRSNIVLVTGGLGPTTDDVTRDAIAKFFSVSLYEDTTALERLKEKFEQRQRAFNDENIRQALFPKGSTIIPNEVGTAEGFKISNEKLTVYSVPGVPQELYPMFAAVISPEIKRLVPDSQIHKTSLKIFGLPEAFIGKRVRELELSKEITVSYRASIPEVEVVLKSSNDSLLKSSREKVIQAIGNEFIFVENSEDSFPVTVSKLLLEKKITLSVAESCTGGMLGSYITNIPGISNSFLGGVISYSNNLKISLLGVSEQTLKSHGAVSAECAAEMAKNCREKCNSTYALSITGIAGPDGGTSEKPVGTFFVGLADHDSVRARKFFFSSSRNIIRKYSAYVALDMLRRSLLGYPHWEYFSTQKS